MVTPTTEEPVPGPTGPVGPRGGAGKAQGEDVLQDGVSGLRAVL